MLCLAPDWRLRAASSLETVEVRGSRKRVTTSSESGIESIPLLAEEGQTLTQALGRLPSVQLSPLSSEKQPDFSIRGGDSTNQRIFWEGIPLTDAQFNASYFQFIPTAAIRRLELSADEVPVRYLADGTGGSLDLKLEPVSDESLWEFQSRLGSYLATRLGARGPLARDVGIAWEFQRSDENFPYWNDNGTPLNREDDSQDYRRHNAFQRVSLLPWWAHTQGEHRFLVATLGGYQDSEIPGEVALPSEMHLRQWFLQPVFRHQYEKRGTAEVSSEIFYRRTSEELASAAESYRAVESPSQTESQLIGAQTHARWVTGLGGLGIHAGGRHHSFHRADDYQNQTLTRTEFPLGISGEWKGKSEIAVRPSALWNFVEDQNTVQSYFSPRLQLSAPLGGIFTLTGQVGSYFRLPTLVEKGGSGRSLTGNPDLAAESARKWGFGIETELFGLGEKIRWSGAYRFSRSDARNLIVLIPNSRASWRPSNIGASSITAHEGTLGFRLGKDWQWQQSVTVLETENRSAVAYERGKALPGRYPWRWFSDLSWERRGWSVRYGASWFSQSYLDVANEQVLAGHWRHDLTFSLATAKLGYWSLEVQNIFNATTAMANFAGESYEQGISGLAGYPVSGRRWYFKWTYAF